ncbi:MAG: hypothetical protein ACJATP_001847 [Candidatus Azotimanducaceae bacterium]|jgi:hypothetical protein
MVDMGDNGKISYMLRIGQLCTTGVKRRLKNKAVKSNVFAPCNL